MRRFAIPHVVAAAALGCALLAGCAARVPDAGLGADGAPPPSRQPLPSWTTPPQGHFTVVATGDVLIHPDLTAQALADGKGARDYRPLLAGVQQVVSSADLAICHLETPLARPEGPFTGWPAFSAPPEVAAALAEVGYDECSTASNHTLDRGPDGVRNTLDILDAAKIGHTGSARSAEEARAPRILDVDGVKVGHVSFTFGFNGNREPNATPWLANQLNANAVLAAAREAKAAGAQVVIASLHWGNEFQAEPTADQQALAKTLLADDAIDLIVGHHAHVVQPFEQVNGKWVAYGLGNLVARHAEPRGTTEEGVIARFRFAKGDDGRWRVDRVDYVPTLIDLGPPIRVLDLTSARDGDRKTTALQRIDQVVHARGAALVRSGG
jgi:poly-gamma-glutamate capsule biosynthesis protein CapA/YwtB (metallophosphatase superfamily)